MILNSRVVSLLSLWERELIVGDLEFARGQSPLPPGEGADLSVILNSRTVSSLSLWERARVRVFAFADKTLYNARLLADLTLKEL